MLKSRSKGIVIASKIKCKEKGIGVTKLAKGHDISRVQYFD